MHHAILSHLVVERFDVVLLFSVDLCLMVLPKVAWIEKSPVSADSFELERELPNFDVIQLGLLRELFVSRW